MLYMCSFLEFSREITNLKSELFYLQVENLSVARANNLITSFAENSFCCCDEIYLCEKVIKVFFTKWYIWKFALMNQIRGLPPPARIVPL